MSVAARRHGRRILALVPFPPSEHARHGGGRLMAQLLAALAERNEVALLALRTGSEPPTGIELRERCALVEEVPRMAGAASLAQRVARRIRLARDLWHGIPQWPSDWASLAYRERACALAADWRPDVVQIEFHVMVQHAPPRAACAAPRVLTEHEPGIVAARERARARRAPGRWLALPQARAWQRFERRALASVDAVVAFTERDRVELAALGVPVPIVRIAPGARPASPPLDAAGVDPPRLLFVGNFGHPPNVEAATRLASRILPRVRARHPAVGLDLVGAAPPAVVRRQASPHVVVSGTVPDVTPYLDRAAVVVAPVRLGGGVRVKVLETLAAGKALVASRLAVEGLDVTDGEEVLLAETDDEFAERISELLDDRSMRTRLAERARQWACARPGWERAAEAYEALYDRLVRAPAHGRGWRQEARS